MTYQLASGRYIKFHHYVVWLCTCMLSHYSLSGKFITKGEGLKNFFAWLANTQILTSICSVEKIFIVMDVCISPSKIQFFWGVTICHWASSFWHLADSVTLPPPPSFPFPDLNHKNLTSPLFQLPQTQLMTNVNYSFTPQILTHPSIREMTLVIITCHWVTQH